MSDALRDPSEAIPASTAAALQATAPLALSTSCQAALLAADHLRRGSRRPAVAMEHLLCGLWAKERGELHAAFDAAGWTFAEFADSLRILGLDAPDVAQVRRAYLEAAAGVRRGFTMPPTTDAVAQALDAARHLARAAPGEPAGEVHLRHLVVGAFAVRTGPTADVFDDRIRRAVCAEVERVILAETAAGRVSVEASIRQRNEATRLVIGGAPEAKAPEGSPAGDAAPPSGRGGGAYNDRAEGDDRLNFTHYVQAFAHLIDSSETRPPLTIGIFGAWGAGKSFLLRHLRQEIERRRAGHRMTRAQLFDAWLARQRRRLRGGKATDARHDDGRAPRTPAYVYCIEFNAWEYNAAEHIWPRLVRRVLDEVEREVRWHRTPLRWARTLLRKLRRNFSRKLRADWKSLVSWLAIGAGVWWGFAHLRPEDAERFAQRVFGIDTSDDKFSVPAILGGLTAAAKLAVDVVLAPLGGWITALLDDGPGYGGESDFVRAVRSDLMLVDEQLIAEGSRALIIIDDLDRCEPNKAVEVLQAINQLLDRRSFVICLGIDARVITAAVEKHYEDLLGPAGITGYEYLDKIVQIPFRIPDPSGDDVAHFISRQLGDPRPAPTAPAAPADGHAPRGPALTADAPPVATADTPPTVDGVPANAPAAAPAESRDDGARVLRDRLSFTHEELQAFAEIRHAIRPNPRHVKRLVNVYALVRSLAHLGGNRTILDAPAATIRWLTLCAQWPYAVHCMLDFLDRNPHLAASSAHGAPTTPLSVLFEAVQRSLDPQKCARFDHDRADLEALIASSAGISWQALRVLRGYTVNFNPALDAELRAEVAEPAGRASRRRRREGAGPKGAYDRRAAAAPPTPSPTATRDPNPAAEYS